MNVDALKLEIITWLTSLDDEELLQYLKLVKESGSQTSDWWNDLSQDQRSKITAGLKDLAEGNLISHQEVKAKYGL